MFPGLNRLRQKNQEHPVRFGIGKSFHLPTGNDQRPSQGRVFCHKLGLASGKVWQRPQQEQNTVRFYTDMKRCGLTEDNACQPLGASATHNERYSFVKMSE